MNRLGVGVIGLGVGAQHAEVYARRPDCELVTLCDLSPEKLAEVGPRFPATKRTTDAAQVLADPSIQIVSIATNDDCHHRQVVEALSNGKHVFVEKPLCLTAGEFGDIKSALAGHPELTLSSNLILRKSPRFIELKELIRDGLFGEIYYVEGDYLYGRLHKILSGWRGEIDGYSVMHGGGIHLIDLLLWLLDEPVVEVMAMGNAFAARGSGFRYNDMVVSLLRFRSGAVGKVSANFGCVHPHFHAVTIYGTKATYVNGAEAALLHTSREPDADPKRLTTAYPGTHKGDLIDSFVNAVQGGPPPEVPASSVLRAMAVSLAIDESVRRGGPVKVGELA
ncbi:MAG TPA: Gfo/Idh/MocA family oxidoreductase [Planctomycetaceae bacterium]|nr:Gfo/Idh/MocA family oxidoreductase [Planctomycetaceae bacterium]